MNISKVRYERTYNTGNFENVKVMAEVDITPNDAYDRAYEFIKRYVLEKAPDYLLLDENCEPIVSCEMASEYINNLRGLLNSSPRPELIWKYNRRFLDKAYIAAENAGSEEGMNIISAMYRKGCQWDG